MSRPIRTGSAFAVLVANIDPFALQTWRSAHRLDAAPFLPSIGANMSTHMQPRDSYRARRLLALVAYLVMAYAALTTLASSPAFACACGCSVFDVGGGLLPQEDDHGGRIFTEWWHSDQTKNWIGGSSGPASANADKHVLTNWYTAGLEYMFNREWGVVIRVPYVERAFTTDNNFPAAPPSIQTFDARSIGDVEVMAMYTGFSQDLSTGIMFGFKLPTGTFTATGLDRDTQIGSGSTDLILGAFHRGMITGDNAWQYFSQVRWLQPFAYQSSYDPGSQAYTLYKPGYQVDGAAGIVYNNLYHVLGFDKIAPLVQIIASHRQHDSGSAADVLNSGFDRLMISPGIEFTKVIDEQNKRVFKFYIDVEVPIYYRTNAAINDSGSQGQLISPYLLKTVASYSF
jgi:hypothetical protein